MTSIKESIKPYASGCSTPEGRLVYAALAGAAIKAFGMDGLLAGLSLPPSVHWALAGVLVNVNCDGIQALDPAVFYAKSAGVAYVAGMLATRVMN